MRHDMFKVIVERARRGAGYYSNLPNEYRRAKRFTLDEDLEVTDEFVGRKISMRRANGWDRKELNENLNPLRRFLDSQVGRRWDDVYAEICENLDTGSTVKQHVRQHIEDFIELKTYVGEDDEIWCTPRWGAAYRVEETYAFRQLYVDPRDGVIRRGKAPSWKQDQKARAAERRREKHAKERVISKELRFEKIDGVWFRLRMKALPTDVFDLAKIGGDVVFVFSKYAHLGYTRGDPEQVLQNAADKTLHAFKEKYGDSVYAVEKRTASKKDIRKYRLNASS